MNAYDFRNDIDVIDMADKRDQAYPPDPQTIRF